MGITKKQIQELQNSMSIGSRFEFCGVTGRVTDKYKHFVVVERDNGYRECFKWIDMLSEGGK